MSCVKAYTYGIAGNFHYEEPQNENLTHENLDSIMMTGAYNENKTKYIFKAYNEKN